MTRIGTIDIGPCDVFFGALGAEVPMGYTQGGVKLNFDTQSTDVEVDQETEPVLINITKRPITITCPFAEYTLEHMHTALPGSKLFTNAATLTTNIAGDNNDMVFTAKVNAAYAGPGNDRAIAYLNPGALTANCSVAVVPDDSQNRVTINVTLKHDGTNIIATAAEVKAAIEASPEAAALVSIAYANSDTGAGIMTAMDATPLAGGKQLLVLESASNERLITLARGLRLHPTGRATADVSMDMYFPVAAPMGQMDITHDKENPKLINVVFRPFPDSNKRVMYMGDRTTVES